MRFLLCRYQRALERSNPVYRPHVPDRKSIEKVFKCVRECSHFLHERGIKSLYTWYVHFQLSLSLSLSFSLSLMLDYSDST